MAYNMEIKANKLIITVDVDDKTIKAAPMSKSGKNKLIASTGSFETVGNVRVGLNVISK
jgi:hypothetical protein